MEVAGEVGVAGGVHSNVAALGVGVGGVGDRHYARKGAVSVVAG